MSATFGYINDRQNFTITSLTSVTFSTLSFSERKTSLTKKTSLKNHQSHLLKVDTVSSYPGEGGITVGQKYYQDREVPVRKSYLTNSSLA